MIIFLDTETTGLNLHGVPSDDPRQPHIASLSAILDDDNGITRQVMSVLISPEGKYKLEDFPEAQKIHGITTERAEKYGWRLPKVLYELDDMARNAEILSGFNIFFDFKMIKIACAKFSASDPTTSEYGEAIRNRLEEKSSICTMENAAANLIGKKRISLKNAYFEMFKEEIQLGHHGSLEDAMAARRVYYELKRRGHPMPPVSLARKEYDMPYQAAV